VGKGRLEGALVLAGQGGWASTRRYAGRPGPLAGRGVPAAAAERL